AAEEKRGEDAQSAEQDARRKDDLQRRFEMAVEEVRELKRANADLENKLKRGGAASGASTGGALDWEAQKQRLLASLPEDDEDMADERTSIEGTIRITDQIVAQKDEEIAELKRQLDLGDDAEPAAAETALNAAAAEILDHDDVIRQEREKLTQAQADWRE